MATYLWFSLLVAGLAFSSQVSGDDCLVPIDNSYYENSDYERPCQRLGDAMVRFRDFMRWGSEVYHAGDNFYEQARQYLLMRTGIDIDQDQQLLDKACQLEGVQSLEGLLEAFNFDSSDAHLTSEYRGIQMVIARVDGFHGIRMGMETKLAVLNALRELTGQPEGQLNYTAVVSSVTPDWLADLLRNLERDFSSGYIIYFLMRPYNAALVGVDHLVLANAILDNDVKCRLGVSEEIARTMANIVGSLFYSGLTREVVDLSLDAFVAADQMGLFNLGQ